MSSGSSGGQCHVDARVHQDLRSIGIRETKSLHGEIEQIPRRKILLANLNPFDTVGQISGDVVDQRCTGRETVTIGDVAAKHALSV